MESRNRRWVPVSVATILLLTCSLALAESYELVVVLDPQGQSAEAVVQSVRYGGTLAGALGTGSPVGASFVMSERAGVAYRSWLDLNPTHPRSVLERSIVLRYSSQKKMTSAMEALQGDSNVDFVEVSSSGDTSSLLPNDPLLPDPSGLGDPETFQWAPYAIEAPEVWGRIRGHAYIGVSDVGVQMTTANDCPSPLSSREGGNEDLRAFHWTGTQYTYDGGSFRAAFAKDVANPDGDDGTPDYCVDDLEPEPAGGVIGGPLVNSDYHGHGTHTAGILAATTNNSLGVSGSGWSSSLLVTKIGRFKDNGLGIGREIVPQDAAEGVTWLVDRGAQVLSMSWNVPTPNPASAESQAIQFASDRDTLMFAAAHNGGSGAWCITTPTSVIMWPARDSRVQGIGAVDPDGEWACYSRWDAALDLVGPGTNILSTFYSGQVNNASPGPNCFDANFGGAADGYALCSGTSMSTPMIAGMASVLRSANPLLSKASVEDILHSSASNTCVLHPDRCGAGMPQGSVASAKAMGSAASQTLVNRLSPMFSLHNSALSDHLFTSVPQMAAAAICADSGQMYQALASPSTVAVPPYLEFPGADCGSPDPQPRASFYSFTTAANPVSGGPELTPVYRLSRKLPTSGDRRIREHRYSTQVSEIQSLKNTGWELDGVEGFIYPPCNVLNACDQTCAPIGTKLLKRYVKSSTSDYVLALANDEALWTGQGFASQEPSCLGFVFPNVDSDGDQLIDGYEELVGTAADLSDSDCDGFSDGLEVSSYSVAAHAYLDPLSQPRCSSTLVLTDDFEAGLHWDATSQSGTFVRTGTTNPLLGHESLEVEVNPNWNGPNLPWGYVRDYLPSQTARYRARFYFSPQFISMAEGNLHGIFVLQSGVPPYSGVAKIQLRKSGGLFQVRLRAFQDNASTLDGAWRTIESTETTAIELDWKGSVGTANDAFAKLWIDGALTDVLGAPFDASDLRVGVANLGIVDGLDAGTFGTHLFDGFESRTATYIGLQP